MRRHNKDIKFEQAANDFMALVDFAAVYGYSGIEYRLSVALDNVTAAIDAMSEADVLNENDKVKQVIESINVILPRE